MKVPFVVTLASVGAIAACGGKAIIEADGSQRGTATGSDPVVPPSSSSSGQLPPSNPPWPINPCPGVPDEPGKAAKPCGAKGVECIGEDKCLARPTDTEGRKRFVCGADGKWIPLSAGYTAPCPAVIPENGTSCADCAGSYEACNYDAGGGCAAHEARCDAVDGKWKILASSCNPPPPDAGSDAP